MAHAKDKGSKTVKKKAQANIKEKRAAKKAKRSSGGSGGSSFSMDPR